MVLNKDQLEPTLHFLHVALISMYTAFLAVSIIFLVAPNLSIPFVRLEININHFLGIRQTDLIRGYFEYLISSMILASCIGIVLHISSGTKLGKEILRSFAGGLLVLAPAIFWFFYYQLVGWAFGWPYQWAPLELVGAMVILTLVLIRTWRIRWWLSSLLFAAHYSFWYLRSGANPDLASYEGPWGPILGFCSAVVWGIYIARLESQAAPGSFVPKC